jgi:hypothetical protein
VSVWGSPGPFDVNAVSPALLEALGAPPGAVTQMVQRRAQAPFHSVAEVAAIGIPTDRLEIDGDHLIWNIRATARLRGPNGQPSEVVRSASAIAVLILPSWRRPQDPAGLRVLRFYEDAWSEFAALPAPATGAMLP